MSVIRKAAIALLSISTVATATFATVTAADASSRRDRAFIGGAIAGVAGAAIIGGLARDRAYGAPVYYEPAPVYYEPRYVYREPVYVRPRAVHYGPRRGVSAHVAYCQGRYRSYDVRSDTYQPNHGPRRYCASPYSR